MNKIDQIYQKCYSFCKLATENPEDHPIPINPVPIDISEEGIDPKLTRTVRPGRRDPTIFEESNILPRIILDNEGKFHLKNNPHLLDENDDFKYSNQDIVDAILQAQRAS